MSSRRGQLLIASPSLRDPNFAKTVVLIVKDEEDGGVLGVILNRPLEVSVADAVRDLVEAAEEVSDPVHQGGPCEGPLIVLHGNPAAGGEEVVEGVRFSMDKEDIQWLMAHNKGPIKYFAGYSGWGAGQLDAEIDGGAWLLTPATADHIFERHGDWSKLSTWMALGGKVEIDRIPDDPSVN
ncbi:MAG TPA: YqgE/AlgH family protein [Tepidisphaeraceae bacterium]|nr:YqgE/AlgH family protein [Tepidisphaeraceae bacterium]